LFVSLGGASYAAITLPPRSVGSRQLRAHAVNVGALTFPLGASSVTDYTVQDLLKGACNSPLMPGEIPPPCVAPVLGGPGNVQPLHLTAATGWPAAGLGDRRDSQRRRVEHDRDDYARGHH
jgi:hypothetical protein